MRMMISFKVELLRWRVAEGTGAGCKSSFGRELWKRHGVCRSCPGHQAKARQAEGCQPKVVRPCQPSRPKSSDIHQTY